MRFFFACVRAWVITYNILSLLLFRYAYGTALLFSLMRVCIRKKKKTNSPVAILIYVPFFFFTLRDWHHRRRRGRHWGGATYAKPIWSANPMRIRTWNNDTSLLHRFYSYCNYCSGSHNIMYLRVRVCIQLTRRLYSAYIRLFCVPVTYLIFFSTVLVYITIYTLVFIFRSFSISKILKRALNRTILLHRRSFMPLAPVLKTIWNI